jgi:hypothetical protein
MWRIAPSVERIGGRRCRAGATREAAIQRGGTAFLLRAGPSVSSGSGWQSVRQTLGGIARLTKRPASPRAEYRRPTPRLPVSSTVSVSMVSQVFVGS